MRNIEIEEIRIGNYYSNSLADEWYHQISASDFMNIYVNGSNGWCAIPLTEKWLTDFGFSKPNDLHCYKLTIDANENKKLESSIQFGFAGCERAEICRCGITAKSCPCEYVHQLQNLYFALTGTELTINPTQP